LGPVLFSSFLGELFKGWFKFLKKSSLVTGAILGTLVISTGPETFTKYLLPIQLNLAITLLGSLGLLIYLRKDFIAKYMLGCMLVMGSGTTVDVLITHQVMDIPFGASQFAFIVFIFAQSYLLALKFAEAYETSERLTEHLQDEVDKRTAELNQTLNETSSLLNNMQQSVFSVDRTGMIIPPVSQYSKEIFGEEVSGKSVFETLFKSLDKESEELSKLKFNLKVSIGENIFQFELLGDVGFPKKVVMLDKKGDDRSLRVAYSPIIVGEVVEKIMMVVEDVTDMEKLERQSKENEAEAALKIQRLQEIVSNDKKDIKLFTREIAQNLSLGDKSVETSDLDGFFRAAHTIKGTARMYGMNSLSQLVHVLESKIHRLRENRPGPDLLYDIIESINESLAEYSNIYVDLCKEVFGDDVDGAFLEGENSAIEIPKDIFLRCMDELRDASSSGDMSSIDKIIKRLETEEFKTTLSSLQNTVSRISISLRKEIELKFEGDDIYLDSKTSSSLKDSIMHIIQNSCDHGIEHEGVIKISLKLNEQGILIDISDNGRGIDHELIYNKAIEKKLVTREESQDYDKKKKLEFIMMPGFSTKEVATEYSGRGVGMDVVRTNIKKLGGSVDLDSTLGEGTQFQIVVPIVQD